MSDDATVCNDIKEMPCANSSWVVSSVSYINPKSLNQRYRHSCGSFGKEKLLRFCGSLLLGGLPPSVVYS